MVGYAPFMLTTDPLGPFSIRTLRFIGNNAGEPGDILYADVAASGSREEVVESLLTHARTSWRVSKWDLGYLHPTSPTNGITRQLLDLGDDDLRFMQSQSYVTLELPSDWDSYARTLTRNTRQSFSRQSRKLEKLGDVQLHVEEDSDAVAQRVRELIENHDRWWRGTSKEGWFGDESVHDFLVSAAELLASQGRFLAFALEVDGDPIAWDVGGFDGDRYFEQLLSYDQQYAAYSPGMILSISFIRHLLSVDVHRVELGPGLDQRKQRLGGRVTRYPQILGHVGWLRGMARFRRLWTRRSVSS
ncbi:MAG: GNAT family N-acetyltransferase [Thermoplasmata archaeon]